MNIICSQCGAVLPSGEHICQFCSVTGSTSGHEFSNPTIQGNLALEEFAREEWRGELTHRLQAYRARRRRLAPAEGQSELPFVGRDDAPNAVAVETPLQESFTVSPSIREEFAFTLAIGRPPKQVKDVETQLLIDVSIPLEQKGQSQTEAPDATVELPSSLMAASASLHDRRSAALIDIACLAFAYGGFLLLFGSLGGQFTFSKLSAAVCFFTFAFVYIQYFGLFTVFGGTTPGMMIRGLRVSSFSGDTPTPRQYLLRAVGYLLSAGTLFLGFFWALWDEDGLTWHDRLSKTYLSEPEVLAELETPHMAGTL